MKQIILSLVFVTSVSTFAQSDRDPLVARLGSAERRFAEKIYSAVAERKTSGNLVLAPYGVFESLTMLQLGARGETLDAISAATGVRLDRATMSAFESVRRKSSPTSMQFGTPVADNGGYGVKVLEAPTAELINVGLGKGDLIFSVDGLPVKTAREFMDACAKSTGKVQLTGFSLARSAVFTRVTAPLKQVRQLDVEPASQVINFASALWLRDIFVQDSAYPGQLAKLFGTKTFASSFRSLDEIAQQANGFFRGRTGGRIAKVNMPEQLNSEAVMMLMNAMAMDAKWERRFKPALTKPGTFTSPTAEMQTEYMHQQNVFAFAKLDNVRVIELPYRSTDLRMTVFLPADKDGWKRIESDFFLSGLELHNLSRQMRPTRVDLKLPKFDIRMSGSLKSSVQGLGLGNLFTKEANFSGIDSSDRVMLDDMRQQVYITTNEEGTRAGSVTQAVGILKSAAMKAEPFHATHPFLFLVRDSAGIVYFAGRVTQPRRLPL